MPEDTADPRICRYESAKERKNMWKRKQKTIWAYLDGKKLVDVVQSALDNNMMVDELKMQLIAENPGHKVTFRCE